MSRRFAGPDFLPPGLLVLEDFLKCRAHYSETTAADNTIESVLRLFNSPPEQHSTISDKVVWSRKVIDGSTRYLCAQGQATSALTLVRRAQSSYKRIIYYEDAPMAYAQLKMNEIRLLRELHRTKAFHAAVERLWTDASSLLAPVMKESDLEQLQCTVPAVQLQETYELGWRDGDFARCAAIAETCWFDWRWASEALMRAWLELQDYDRICAFCHSLPDRAVADFYLALTGIRSRRRGLLDPVLGRPSCDVSAAAFLRLAVESAVHLQDSRLCRDFLARSLARVAGQPVHTTGDMRTILAATEIILDTGEEIDKLDVTQSFSAVAGFAHAASTLDVESAAYRRCDYLANLIDHEVLSGSAAYRRYLAFKAKMDPEDPVSDGLVGISSDAGDAGAAGPLELEIDGFDQQCRRVAHHVTVAENIGTSLINWVLHLAV